MTDSLLVSIIMPTYNSEATVQESIASVLAQTYENWELIITDDCSTDRTVDILKNIEDSRIKVLSLSQNSGAGAARNHSISKATGTFIAFLDSDDLWHPEKLAKQIQFMRDNNHSFTFTSYQKICNGHKAAVVNAPATTTYNSLLYSNTIGCLTAVYNQEDLGKHYMPLIRKRQDMALWLELLKITPKAYSLAEPLAYYRTNTGMTTNKLTVISYQWKFYREIAKLSFTDSLFKMLIYSIRGVIKTIR